MIDLTNTKRIKETIEACDTNMKICDTLLLYLNQYEYTPLDFNTLIRILNGYYSEINKGNDMVYYNDYYPLDIKIFVSRLIELISSDLITIKKCINHIDTLKEFYMFLGYKLQTKINETENKNDK